MAKGWVKIHRELADHKLWLKDKFSSGQAWADLILLANHKEGHINFRGNIIRVLRGQVGWAETTLAKRWKWSRGRVRRFLIVLEVELQITRKTEQYPIQQAGQKKKALYTVITITNYDKYQHNDTEDDTGYDTENGQKTDTNKNDKNEKKKRRGAQQFSFYRGRRRPRLIAPPSPESLPGYKKPVKH